MNFVRWILGRLVLGYDLLTRPKRLVREEGAQAAMDARTAHLVMYQFQACPFCVKVRRQMRKYGLNIELRDARKDPAHKQALIEGGGRYKVPCLQITADSGETSWLYESDDIIAYLKSELELA
tara:strand:+ start:87 stop:455 length:369 start_codon:yes stop_codon:yes gene_type:complete